MYDRGYDGHVELSADNRGVPAPSDRRCQRKVPTGGVEVGLAGPTSPRRDISEGPTSPRRDFTTGPTSLVFVCPTL